MSQATAFKGTLKLGLCLRFADINSDGIKRSFLGLVEEGRLFVGFELNPLWDAAFGALLAGALVWYHAENPKSQGIGAVRRSLFTAGILLAFILLVGPLAHAAIHSFWIHMVQHVGLMMLISPLIVLGSPVRVAVNSRFPIVKKWVLLLGRNALIRQLFRPQIGFLLFLTILTLTHFSPLADAGMINPNVHSFELILFFVGGFIYYLPVMEGNPTPFHVPHFHRVASLFAMMVPETMTGFFLYSGNKLLHETPSGTDMAMGIHDQHQGGAIMWAMGMLIDAIWIVLAARDWFNNEKLLAEAEDDL